MTADSDPSDRAKANRVKTRIHAMEALIEAIESSGEDGNVRKVEKIVENLYALGLMPITVSEQAGFENPHDLPTALQDYYLVCDKHIEWMDDHAIDYAILRKHEYGVTELTLQKASESKFASAWIGGEPSP